MKWIKDNTGRFSHRPYYMDDELNNKCESIIISFLTEKYGSVSYPISTNDITILIEQRTSHLDLFADLSNEGDNIEGMTVFELNDLPKVFVSYMLSEISNLQNRLRTTLTHELGHVVLHGPLLKNRQLSMFEDYNTPLVIKSNRNSFLNTKKIDWMEWQAGFASGAFLMPVMKLHDIFLERLKESNLTGIQSTNSPFGRELIGETQKTFLVSSDAARVRLIQLGYLADLQGQQVEKELF